MTWTAAMETQAEWVHATGEVIPAMGRIIVTESMVSVEDCFSRDFDLCAAGADPMTATAKAFNKKDMNIDELEQALQDDDKPKRGQITDFTRASQTRMMKAVSAWSPRGKMLLITLTYPRKFPKTKEAKRHFVRFQKFVRTLFPEWAGLWKLEYQVRGAPHFHLVIDVGSEWTPDLSYLMQWVNDTWKLARRSNESARTKTEWAYHRKASRFYLTKEAGKSVQCSQEWRSTTDSNIEHYGRFWGWFNRKQLKFKASEIQVPAKIALLVRQKVQRLVLNDMRNAGRITEKDGVTYYSNGEELDERKLPAWQLVHDSRLVFRRIIEEVREETGYDLQRDGLYMTPGWRNHWRARKSAAGVNSS